MAEKEINVLGTEGYEIEMEEVLPLVVSEGGTMNHALLNNRETPNQHPIVAIEGLREELDEIKTLKTVYSDKIGVANYYKWNEGAYDVFGYFVSMKTPDTIEICTGTDIFGVTVDGTMVGGFVGGQDATTTRDNTYALVVTSGIAEVRCESGVAKGDYVVCNDIGIAKKTDTGCGYKVVGLETRDGTNYAIISLGVQACTTDVMGAKLQYLKEHMDSAEITISGLSNSIANAKSEIDEIKGDASNALDTAGDALEKAEAAEKNVDDAITAVTGAQAAANAAQSAAEIARNEAVDAANAALAGVESTNGKVDKLIANVDKYSVGEHSQSYRLTINLARDILTEGMIYIPVGNNIEESYVFKYNIETDDDGKETFDKVEFDKEFPQGNYYVWTNNIPLVIEDVDASGFWWQEHIGKVYYDGDLPEFETFDYWFPNVSNVTDGYKSKTLYVKTNVADEGETESYEWVEEACLSGNANNRLVGLLRSNVDSVNLEISNARGDAVTLQERLDADGARFSLTASKVFELDGATLTYVGDPGDYPNADALNDIESPDGTAGVCYLVGTTIPYDVYQWNGTEFVKNELLHHDGINFCKVNAAAIVGAVNNSGESSLQFSADKINFNAGTYQINASKIKFDCEEDYTISAGHVEFSTDDFKIYPIDEEGNPEEDKEPNFSVDERGNIAVKGTVHANEGSIAGWKIDSDSISKDKTGIYTGTGYKKVTGMEDVEPVGPYISLEKLEEAVTTGTVVVDESSYYLIGSILPYEVYQWSGEAFVKSDIVIYEEVSDRLFSSLIEEAPPSPVRFYAGKSDMLVEKTEERFVAFPTHSLETISRVIDIRPVDRAYYNYTSASIPNTTVVHNDAKYTVGTSIGTGAIPIAGSQTNYAIDPIELPEFLPSDLTAEQITSLTFKPSNSESTVDLTGVHINYSGNGSVILDGYMPVANAHVEISVEAVFNYNEELEISAEVVNDGKGVEVIFTPKLKGVSYTIPVDCAMVLVEEEEYQFRVLEDGSLYAKKMQLGSGELGEDNSVFLSTTDMAGVDGFFGGADIDNWRMTVGENFGVTSDGGMYAASGEIGGWEITDDRIFKNDMILTTSDDLVYQSLITDSQSPIRMNVGEIPEKGIKSITYSDLETQNYETVGNRFTVTIKADTTVTSAKLISYGCSDKDCTDIMFGETEIEILDNLIILHLVNPNLDENIGFGFTIEYVYDIASPNFCLLEDGSLYVGAAEITGEIKATAGYIGYQDDGNVGWAIGANKISGDGVSLYTGSNYIENGKQVRISVGANENLNANPFRVFNDGYIIASNGKIGSCNFYPIKYPVVGEDIGYINEAKISTEYDGLKQSRTLSYKVKFSPIDDYSMKTFPLYSSDTDNGIPAKHRFTWYSAFTKSNNAPPSNPADWTMGDQGDMADTSKIETLPHLWLKCLVETVDVNNYGEYEYEYVDELIYYIGDFSGYITTLSFGDDSLRIGKNIITGKTSSVQFEDTLGRLSGTWYYGAEPIEGSCRGIKHDIENLDDRYSILFDKLRPVRFKYNDGQSDRYHTGLILDELKTAMDASNVDTSELAAYCVLNETTGEGGIRYGELISLCIGEIQKLKKRVTELEDKLNNAK